MMYTPNTALHNNFLGFFPNQYTEEYFFNLYRSFTTASRTKIPLIQLIVSTLIKNSIHSKDIRIHLVLNGQNKLHFFLDNILITTFTLSGNGIIIDNFFAKDDSMPSFYMLETLATQLIADIFTLANASDTEWDSIVQNFPFTYVFSREG